MNREDYKPTPYELLKNHLMTIAEAGPDILDFEEETVKVLALANDFKKDMITSLPPSAEKENIIDDWLDKNGDHRIDEQVKKEAKDLAEKEEENRWCTLSLKTCPKGSACKYPHCH